MTTLRRVAGQPTWLVSRTHARAQRLLGEAFGAEGFRGYHFRVLAALDEHGPRSQADLGRLTGIDRSDIVATVNDLVARGLATREPDRTDRRRNVVTTTPDGVGRLERLDAALHGVQDDLLAPLTPDERATFVRLLEKLVSDDVPPGEGSGGVAVR
ncbi:winged helix-turn-helix transcriptional regulator [Nocardioides anomalus]|uniref:Winged helix-turn-helix transcriptional regulator n=1 Tax=Nocardioides anomalus TaxID=2712223 RepID=A0A6G6WAZ8_9ACTN|nr:MarR family winged helix-turn-helix transcriptional regulator [Nocardioides anomalus]QIG42508.1 winged helix-turn-helix transcriptional regulator [Nocardioides anomalus]